MSEFSIFPLQPQHDRSQFACGVQVLDAYLKQFAVQNMRSNIARVFVACQQERIIGYYTLSAISVTQADLPEAAARKLPKYPIPAVLLGRLAVDTEFQSQRMGEMLLVDAMRRVVRAAEAIGVYALIVDAKDERAQAFYLRYGFMVFPSQPLKLFIPLATIASAQSAPSPPQ